jgi:hypothetical protein
VPLRVGEEVQEVLRRCDGELTSAFLSNRQQRFRLLVESPAWDSALTVGSQWESSRQQNNTATARRSPTPQPHTVGGGATGSTPTARCLPGKLSMRRAATSTASRWGMATPDQESSSHASTARSPTASTGSRSVSTSMFGAWALTSGAATDSAPAYTRLRGWTGSQCVGSRMAACASRKSANGRACEPEERMRATSVSSLAHEQITETGSYNSKAREDQAGSRISCNQRVEAPQSRSARFDSVH